MSLRAFGKANLGFLDQPLYPMGTMSLRPSGGCALKRERNETGLNNYKIGLLAQGENLKSSCSPACREVLHPVQMPGDDKPNFQQARYCPAIREFKRQCSGWFL